MTNAQELIKPDAEYGFLSTSCILPQCTWLEICGFTDQEIARYDDLIQSAVHLIHNCTKGYHLLI